jgi:hypothetical protein
MLFNDNTHRVAISEIKIERDQRQRRELEGIESLANSIRLRGLFHPIILDRDMTLIAGERRIEARRRSLPGSSIRSAKPNARSSSLRKTSSGKIWIGKISSAR